MLVPNCILKCWLDSMFSTLTNHSHIYYGSTNVSELTNHSHINYGSTNVSEYLKVVIMAFIIY